MAECTKVKDSTELPRGGYCGIDFLDHPPDSLQCPICLSTLKQPHILSCCGSHICEVSCSIQYSILLYSLIIDLH